MFIIWTTYIEVSLRFFRKIRSFEESSLVFSRHREETPFSVLSLLKLHQGIFHSRRFKAIEIFQTMLGVFFRLKLHYSSRMPLKGFAEVKMRVSFRNIVFKTIKLFKIYIMKIIGRYFFIILIF